MIDAAHLDRLHAGIRTWEGRREKVRALEERRRQGIWSVHIAQDPSREQWKFSVQVLGGPDAVTSRHGTLDEALGALLDWFYPEEAE